MPPPKPKVFLTRELPPKAMERLRSESQLTWNREDRPLSRAELLEGVKGQDGVICLLTDAIDAEVMNANPALKVIANYAVGYNNIDVAEATRRGIPVTNTPDVLTDATADMAWTLLMAAARRLVEGDRLVRSGGWKGWGPLQLLGREVSGATLGLVGLGRIGRAMVPRAKGFGMRVLYWNRTRLGAAEERELGVGYAEADDVFREADFVSLHIALNDETRHFVNARRLALMKPTACLVNTTRGPVVDEKALVKALRAGAIAGAGLDVFEREPELEAGLAELDNATLAPHLGSATIQTRTSMGLIAAENCLAACRGERPPQVVNLERKR